MRYRLRPLSYPETNTVLMLCSKSSYTTLLNLKFKWIPEVNTFLPRVPKIMVVNKSDLNEPDDGDELITDEIIEKAFKELKVKSYFKVSCLTGDNINDLLQETAKLSMEPAHRVQRFCKVL